MRSLRIVPNLIIIPKRELVKVGNRWIVYLPIDMNDLWEEIKRQGRKVRLYVEVVE